MVYERKVIKGVLLLNQLILSRVHLMNFNTLCWNLFKGHKIGRLQYEYRTRKIEYIILQCQIFDIFLLFFFNIKKITILVLL